MKHDCTVLYYLWLKATVGKMKCLNKRLWFEEQTRKASFKLLTYFTAWSQHEAARDRVTLIKGKKWSVAHAVFRVDICTTMLWNFNLQIFRIVFACIWKKTVRNKTKRQKTSQKSNKSHKTGRAIIKFIQRKFKYLCVSFLCHRGQQKFKFIIE